MTRKMLMLIAAAGSAALLLGALGFQYIGEMPPCQLCYWQRYGHFGAVGAGLLALLAPIAIVALLGAAAVFSSAVIGFYHTGVERNWWEGPTTCTAQSVTDLTPEQAIEAIMNAPLVRCDEVPWEMLGLSMASWNALAALALTALWVLALRRA